MSPNMRRIALLLALAMLAHSGAFAQEPPAGEPAVPGPPPAAAPAAIVLAEPPPFLRLTGPRPFLEIGIDVNRPVFDGTRSAPAAYQPVFPGRVPWINFGEHDGGAALVSRFGLRLGGGWGEMFAGLSFGGGQGEVIYANGDPLLDRLGNNPVVEALNRRPTSEEDDSGGPPPIRPGFFDPAGAALALSSTEKTVVDLGYGNHLALGRLDVGANAGGRLGILYHQDRSLGLGVSSFTSTHFLGGGPMAQIDWRWWSARPDGDGDGGGWQIYGRVGTSMMFGRVRQSYREAVGAPYLPSYIDVLGESARMVPTLEVECGIAVHPFSERNFLRVGYRFDRWWDVGGLGPDRYNFSTHGLVLRWTAPY